MAARSILTTLFAVLILACGDGSNSGIVAKVNDYKITATELEAYYASQYQDQDEPENPEQAQMLRLNLLRELIDRHLILQKAESLGLMAVDDEVDQQLENYRSPFDSEDEFVALLAGASGGEQAEQPEQDPPADGSGQLNLLG